MSMSSENGDLEQRPERGDAMTRAMRLVAASAASAAEAANRLVDLGREQSATSDLVRGAIERVATGVESSSAAVQELARSQASVAEMAAAMQAAIDGNAATTAQVAAAIAAMRKETATLATGAETTATTMEEMDRSVRG